MIRSINKILLDVYSTIEKLIVVIINYTNTTVFSFTLNMFLKSFQVLKRMQLLLGNSFCVCLLTWILIPKRSSIHTSHVPQVINYQTYLYFLTSIKVTKIDTILFNIKYIFHFRHGEYSICLRSCEGYYPPTQFEGV